MSRRNDRGDDDDEEEFEAPSCQCLNYKGICTCTYPVYAHAYASNGVNNTTSPVQMSEEEDSSRGSIGNPMRTVIFCQECQLNFELSDFVSDTHECYRLPIGFNIEPIIGETGASEKNTDLECNICKKHYNKKYIHCNQCHNNYVLAEFRNENHKCFSIPSNLKIESSKNTPVKRKIFEKEEKKQKKFKKRRSCSPVQDIIYFSSEPSEGGIYCEVLACYRVRS